MCVCYAWQRFSDSVHTVVVAGRRGHPLDPVHWWLEYTRRVPAPASAAAFDYMQDGVYTAIAMVHTEFVGWVKALLTKAGFDAALFAGHSFRRGAASYSFLVGLPEFLIKELGASRSRCTWIYPSLRSSQP